MIFDQTFLWFVSIVILYRNCLSLRRFIKLNLKKNVCLVNSKYINNLAENISSHAR